MKRSILTALLLSSFFTPVIAAEVPFTSAVGEVTVYPRGAQVTRTAAGKVPAGDNVVIISDLPGNLIANSVRVEGTSGQSLEIGSVDVRQVKVLRGDNQDERRKIERQIELLNDQIARQNQIISNANTQRNLVQHLATNATLPRPGGQGVSVAISASDLGALLNLTGIQLAELSTVTEKARVEIRNLSHQIVELQKQLPQTAPKRTQVTIVAINLSSKTPTDASFRIRYNVSNAGWVPVYDAKLSLGKKGENNAVKLVRRASVSQSTNEKWDNIKLTLSTARPSAATQAPVLHPYLLSEFIAVPYAKRIRGQNNVGLSATKSMESDSLQSSRAPAPIKRKNIAVAFSGFLAEYSIPGQVSIANVGAKKNVVIGEQDFAADISVSTTPKLDKAAYLIAKFTLKADTPYLPGTVLLSRDGVFLGRSHLPLLNPNEDHKLSFGRDDFIKVERNKITEKARESGFVSRSKQETRKFVTTITNLHDFPIKVVVNDQLPYSTHEDIQVNLTSDSTKPTIKNVEKKRGILAWEKMLPATEKFTVNFGYTVTWPKEMKITPVR